MVDGDDNLKREAVSETPNQCGLCPHEHAKLVGAGQSWKREAEAVRGEHIDAISMATYATLIDGRSWTVVEAGSRCRTSQMSTRRINV